MNKFTPTLALICSTILLGIAYSQQCGPGRLCPNHLCCSIWGFCGSTQPWCGTNCQSQCWSQERADHRCGSNVGNPPCGQGRCCSTHGWCGGGNAYCGAGNCQYRCWSSANHAVPQLRNLTAGYESVGGLVSESLFEEMFSHRKDCPSQDFYSYHAFLTATEAFPDFGTFGDVVIRKREVAAFLAQISLATGGEWTDVEDPNGWGLCHINTTTSETDRYTSRGAIQLSGKFNYKLAGQAIGEDLVNDPDLVAIDPIISFKTAIWFWMAQHDNKPSCHDILLKANGSPRNPMSHADAVIRKIINNNNVPVVVSSLGYYKRYCDLLGVSHGYGLKYWLDDTSSSDFAPITMVVG